MLAFDVFSFLIAIPIFALFVLFSRSLIASLGLV